MTQAALDRHRRGVAAGAAGRPAAAAEHFRTGLRLLEPAPPSGSEALTARLLTSLAHAEAELGRVERGLKLLDRAESLANAQQRAIVISQRGLLLWRAGRYEAALRCFDEAIPLLADHPDRLVLARVLLNRSGLHLGTARVAAARVDLERCERIARFAGDEMLADKAVHNLGYCDLLLGNIPAALDAFGRVEAIFREHAPGNVPVVQIDRARALLSAGLADDAAAELESAIAAFRDQRLSQDRAEAELASAQALAAADKPVQAAARARQAQRHFLARGNETWAALAELTRARADFAALTAPGAAGPASAASDKAAHRSRSALTRLATRTSRLAERLRELGLPNDAALARLLAARALIQARKPDDGIAPLLDASRSRGSAVPLELRLFAHLTRAERAAAQGNRTAALTELRNGLSRLDEHRRSLGSLDLQTGTAALGRELTRTGLRLALDRGSARSIFDWSERSRAQAFRIRPVQPPDDPVTAAAIAEYRHLDALLRTSALRGKTDPQARQRHAALQRELRERSWTASASASGTATYVDTATELDTAANLDAATRASAAPAGRLRADPSAVSLSQVAAELSASNQVMISLLRQGDRLLALVLADGRATLVPLGDYRRAVEAAHRLLGDLEARAARSLPARLQAVVDQSIRRQLGALTDEIAAPLRPLLSDLPVVIVPTGPLATVPWSLLPDLRGRPVTVCPSAQLWLAARRAESTEPGGDQPDPSPVLAAGPRLAHAEAEVAAIAGLYPRPRVLTGKEATVEATLRAIDGAHTVHLAAHGHHERGNVMFARIDLADGPLMAYDLQRLARPPRRVILSACELGRADVRIGDEHLGFTAALLYAGTGTVISSGMLIPDADAPPFMAALHKALISGATPAGALAAATASDRDEPFVCFGAG
ncbi:MAG TPA: CHAT domain-containing protein [Actinocrinis sp.]|nr:CHAT domain-containing protein [Actinocrinis sp.]